MEPVPATVIGVRTAPLAGHAERRPAQLHHVRGVSSGRGLRSKTRKASKRRGGGVGNWQRETKVGGGRRISGRRSSCPCRRERRDSIQGRTRGGSCGASATKTMGGEGRTASQTIRGRSWGS
jgi:hypothetical protein